MVKIILVTHGDMAKALLSTAANICSFDEHLIDVFTVSGKINLEDLSAGIKDKLDPSGTLILVDTFGGTSCNLAATLTHGMENVNVVCGVNLNMLLAAINNRDKMSPSELARKVLDDGKKAVINATEKLK